MTPTFAVFTYLIAWWIMLFIVMPFYIHTGEHRSSMEYAAAPKTIRWKRALVVNTLAAAVVTFGLYLLLKSGLVPLRNVYY